MGCACGKAKINGYYEAKSGQSPPETADVLGRRTKLRRVTRKLTNVKDVHRMCQDTVTIVNETQRDIHLQFAKSMWHGKQLCHATVNVGSEFEFNCGENDQFDFTLIVNKGETKAHVVRGGSYKVVGQGCAMRVETVALPQRKLSQKLADTKGLSVGMSASGWLVIYQLGAVECLQNHGIARNPYVRVSGASGGALALAVMMYGADPREVRDVLIESAKAVHADPSQNLQLRRFILDAMKVVIRDDSFQHPAFKSERVEIAVSASDSSLPGLFSKILLTGSEKRCTKFQSTADIVVALLASSTIGISGLPFSMTDENGKEIVVADGGFKNVMPTIDKHTIKVKPFCDGLHCGATGQSGDVRPTEYVPDTSAMFPPSVPMLQHLYELGYQDMENWIENELAGRLEAISADACADTQEELPPVEYESRDNGMSWYNNVLKLVPVGWFDMMKHTFYADEHGAKSIACKSMKLKSFGAKSLGIKSFRRHGAGEDEALVAI